MIQNGQAMQKAIIRQIQDIQQPTQHSQILQIIDGNIFMKQSPARIDNNQGPFVTVGGNVAQFAQDNVDKSSSSALAFNSNENNGMVSPFGVTVSFDQDVFYVNPLQYNRIVKRRLARMKLKAQGRIPESRQIYLHESRHKHALNRIRDKGGRFCSGSVKKKVE